MNKESILWDVWYSYTHKWQFDGTEQIGRIHNQNCKVYADTIEEAISMVKSHKPEEEREVYRVEDIGIILV